MSGLLSKARENEEKADKEALSSETGDDYVHKAVLRVNADLLLCAQPGTLVEVVTNDVPPGTRVVVQSYDVEHDRFVFVLEGPGLPKTHRSHYLPNVAGPVFKEVRTFEETGELVEKEWEKIDRYVVDKAMAEGVKSDDSSAADLPVSFEVPRR